jgi:hypothetical protein
MRLRVLVAGQLPDGPRSEILFDIKLADIVADEFGEGPAEKSAGGGIRPEDCSILSQTMQRNLHAFQEVSKLVLAFAGVSQAFSACETLGGDSFIRTRWSDHVFRSTAEISNGSPVRIETDVVSEARAP